jgi:hypothetical protein
MTSRAMHHYGLLRLRHAFNWLAQRADLMRLLAAVLGRMRETLNGRMREAWFNWADAVVSNVRAQQNMRRALTYMVQTTLTGRFRMFEAYSTHLAKVRYSLVWLSQRRLAKGWRTIFEHTASRAAAKEDLRARAAANMISRPMARCWRMWLSNASGGSTAKRLMLKGLKFMLHREMSRGWSAWTAARAERAEKLRLLRKGLSYMRHRKTAGALLRWMSNLTDGKEVALARRGLAHLRNRNLSKGFNSWCEMIMVRARAKRAFAHLRNRNLSKGFNSWCEMIMEREEAKKLLHKSVSYMINRKLASGFGGWRRICGKRGSVDPMSRAIKYFLSRSLARGWISWESSAAETRRKRDSMRRSLLHLFNREKARGWTSWRAMIEERQAAMKLLRKGMLFMMHREAARGWSRWQITMASDTLALATKAEQQFVRAKFNKWRRGKRKRDLVARALLHAMNRDLARGWHHICSRHAASKEALGRRAVAFWTSRLTVRGFHAWLAQKEEEDERSHLIFSSAAAMLPIAVVIPDSPPTGSDELFRQEMSPSPSGRKKASRAPARPRMIFH